MNNEEYLKAFKSLTEEMYAITKSKNHDYTGDKSDPFKNFKQVENFGVMSAEAGFFTRMTDKMSRLATFIKVGSLKVQDEKVEDTLLDLANYCLLLICYRRSKNDE